MRILPGQGPIVKISVTIMAHPKRRQQANILWSKLAGYPFIHCYITWDTKNNEWDTGRRALEVGKRAYGDWHLILQDDAIIPDDFWSLVHEAIMHVPDRTLISLYTGTVRPYPSRVATAVKKAQDSKRSWLRHSMLLWGVAIVLPTAHIEHLIEYVGDKRFAPNSDEYSFSDEAYDTKVGIFYQRNRLPIFYTNPSLVDHDDGLGSLLANDRPNDPPRVAHDFVQGNVNWNSKYVDI